MSLSFKTRKQLRSSLSSTKVGNELADMLGGILQKTQITCIDNVNTEVKEITKLVCPAVTADAKEITQIICVDDTSLKEQTQLVCPAHLPEVKEITQLIAVAETSVKEKTQAVCPAELSVAEITQLICVAETSVKEKTQLIAVADTGAFEETKIVARADIAGDLDGTYFIVWDDQGSVAFWIAIDDGATVEPAHGADRSVRIGTVSTGDLIGTVGTAVYTAIVADSKFTAVSDDTAGTIIVANSIGGNRIDGSNGTSGFTVTQNSAGVASNLDGKYFVMYDEVGSIGCYFNVDDRGTTAPAGALACDRQLEIETVTSGMLIGAVGTAVYNKLIGDSKFDASSDNAAGTIVVEASLSGVRTASADGDSGFTISVDILGVASNYDGTFVKMYDNDGSVAFWFDVDDRGTTAPVHGCDRAVEINTVTNGMVIGAVGTAIYTAMTGDSGFAAHNDDAAGTIQVACTLSGARTAASAETSPLTPSVHQAGVASNYDGTYFIMSDEVGTVAFWFDLDDRGTVEPAHGADRSVEINTVTVGMTAGQAGTAIYNKVNADAKFVGDSDNTAGTIVVEASLSGVRAASTGETSPLGVSRDTLGVASNFDGLFFKIYDDAGSVGVWFDVDDRGTTIPVGAVACDRAIEVNTVTNGMAIGAVGTAIYNKLIADAKFDANADDTAGTIKVEASVAGVRTAPSDETSPCTLSVDTAGRVDNYDGLYFIMFDEVADVGFWFDVDNSGTAEPAHGCARSVEINTITSGMTAGQVGTAIYGKITGDAKFAAVSDDTAGTIVVTSSTYGAKTTATQETSPCTITVDQAGVDSNYNQKYLKLHDNAGTVGVWFDVDAVGAAAPAGALACDRQIKVNTISSEDLAAAIGTAIYTVIVADSEFEAGVDGLAGTFTVQNADAGVRILATAETSPCTVSRTQEGSDNYNGTTFIMYDEAGSVGIWFDVDDHGTTIPAEASACDRAIEVNTVLSGMTNVQAATAIYNKVIADSEFEAGADAGDGSCTIRATVKNEKIDSDASTSPITVSTTVQGVTSNWDGVVIVLSDSVGTVGFWVDVDNAGTTIPTEASACDRATEITGINSGMTNVQAAAIIATAIGLDSEFANVADLGNGYVYVEAAAVGLRSGQYTNSSVVHLIERQTGAEDGGTLSDDANDVLATFFFDKTILAEVIAAFEGGSGSTTLSYKAKHALDSVISNRSAYREIVALFS